MPDLKPIEEMLRQEFETAQRRMPYWDWVFSVLESKPQSNIHERADEGFES